MQSSVGVAGTGWARLRLRLASGARGRANTGGSISSRSARCARVRPARGLCVCCAARTPKSQERVGGPNARRPRVELGASAATLALRLERWRWRKRWPGLEHESERGACDRGATGRAKGGRPGRARGRRCLCRVLGCPCPGSLLPPRPFLCPQVSPSAWKSPGAPLHREEGGAKAASRGHHPTPHGGQIPSGGSAAGGLSAPWGGSPARPCSEGMATSGPGDTRRRDGNRSEQRRQALALRGSPAAGVRARLRPPSLCLPSAPPGGGKPRSQCWRLGEPPGPSLAHALQSKESVLVTATGGGRAGDPGGHRGQSTGPARGRRGPSSTAAWGRPHPPPHPACQSRRFFKRF